MIIESLSPSLNKQLANLRTLLREESPDLVPLLATYRQMDKVFYRLGLMRRNRSIALSIDTAETESVGRAIRSLEGIAREIETDIIPTLNDALARWRKLTLWGDVLGLILAGVAALGAFQVYGQAPFVWAYNTFSGYVMVYFAVVAVAGLAALGWHHVMRMVAAYFVRKRLVSTFGPYELDLHRALKKNIRPWRSLFGNTIAGWGKGTQNILGGILIALEEHAQRPNVQV